MKKKRSLLPHAVFFIPAVIADVVTLGGTVNDGYFRNGGQSYTSRVLRDAARVIAGKIDSIDE